MNLNYITSYDERVDRYKVAVLKYLNFGLRLMYGTKCRLRPNYIMSENLYKNMLSLFEYYYFI